MTRAPRITVAALIAAGAIVGPVGGPLAHPFAPGYLELTAAGPSRWHVALRQPKVGLPSRIEPVWPEGCRARRIPGETDTVRWTLSCSGRLQRLGARGFAGGIEEVLVRVVTSSTAPTELYRLSRASPSVERPPPSADPGAWPALGTYAALGVEHILIGYDHLAFVLLMFLLLPSTRAIIGCLSLFTVAHSVTLALSALGLVVLPPAPTEAAIALSIVFTAREVLRPRGSGHRRTYGLAFGFGLLHGLGLAGALTEVGLPPGRRPEALVGFNLGVEGGQLAVVVLLSVVRATVRRLAPTWADPPTKLAVYGVGALAVFWTEARVWQMWWGRF